MNILHTHNIRPFRDNKKTVWYVQKVNLLKRVKVRRFWATLSDFLQL